MTLMSIKEGMKRFGNEGNNALIKELNQLINKKPYSQGRRKTCHMMKERNH